MYVPAYLNTATDLLKKYNGSIPLSHFLKKYFSLNKKHGSKDRKAISHFCYCYFRMGHSLKNLLPTERLLIAIYLCSTSIKEYEPSFEKNWLDNYADDLLQRIKFIQLLYPMFSINDIFPWKDELSETIDAAAFAVSHLIQPDLFLRIRQKNKEQVIARLHQSNIKFQQIDETCLSLNNGTKIEHILALNKEVVVQDYSSQKLQQFLQLINRSATKPITVWDCCAGSGGKSILAYDILQNIDLTVSDVRTSIIQNLYTRFKKAGIKKYKNLLAYAEKNQEMQISNFDLIICDVPCTGSGTWSRTPEQMYFFSKEKIDQFVRLQQKIIMNTLPALKAGGYFLYITCSAFKKENEQITEFIMRKFNIHIIKKEILKGYERKADTMFATLFSSNA